jgi:DNA-binding NarL/FixJ family response regulator
MPSKKPQAKSEIRKTKIVVVDDHPIVRQGLAELINREEDLVVCGQAEDAHRAMQIINELKPNMVIVDIFLKETSGMELIKDIKARYPSLLVLALSMHDESLYVERALRAGAEGYVMKAEATENIVRAIRRVISGQIYLSDTMAPQMVRKLVGADPDAAVSTIERLSDRELEVFNLIGQGYTTRQIAQSLSLSIKTIETYRAHIKEKLNLENAAKLLRYAILWVNSQDKSQLHIDTS